MIMISIYNRICNCNWDAVCGRPCGLRAYSSARNVVCPSCPRFKRETLRSLLRQQPPRTRPHRLRHARAADRGRIPTRERQVREPSCRGREPSGVRLLGRRLGCRGHPKRPSRREDRPGNARRPVPHRWKGGGEAAPEVRNRLQNGAGNRDMRCRRPHVAIVSLPNHGINFVLYVAPTYKGSDSCE